MSETLTNGVIVPDKGSRDWYADLRSNWLKLDSLMAGGNITVNPAQTKGILVATITVGGKEYKLYQQDGDVSVKIDPSAENAEYPLVASTSAEANTGSVVMAPAVTVNPSTGAVTATSFKGKLEGNASTATNATKAVQDGAGAVITDTYATKSELGSKADDANVVHKSGTETIVGTKTFSGDVNISKIAPYYNVFSSGYIKGQAPTSNIYSGVRFYDDINSGSTNGITGSFEIEYNKDGYNRTFISSRNYAEKTQKLYHVGLRVPNDNTRSIDFLPSVNGVVNLGTPSYKWKAVYANSVVVNDKNVLTDANQIMLCKNLTGANIDIGGVVDCGDGNGKLGACYVGETGEWIVANTKPTGKWKNTSMILTFVNAISVFVKVG